MTTYFTRREALWLGLAAGASSLFGVRMHGVQNLVPAVKAVDHLLLGISDLDRGIAWVEKVTGVKATIGGSHPGVGTRNALLSLGGRQYLEIIAPDPAQASFNSRNDVRKLAEPRLIAWAAAASDVEALAKKATADGRKIFGPRDGSRARPDGKVLRWKTLAIIHDFGVEIDPVPFFIEWAPDSLHPSQDSAPGCTLRSFAIESPEASRLGDTLEGLGIAANVTPASSLRLTAVLDTPQGTVTLT
jgi:hypothetical protein